MKVANAIRLTEYMSEAEICALTAELVLRWGMQPSIQRAGMVMPDPVEGCTWVPCWQRGLDRLAASGAAALP